jgi:thymidine kinase
MKYKNKDKIYKMNNNDNILSMFKNIIGNNIDIDLSDIDLSDIFSNICSKNNEHKKGKLEIIIGPMFSGKSTEVIRRIRLLKCISKKILIIKPFIDNRYDQNKISSHNYDGESCITVNKLYEISEIKDLEIESYDTIIIDEAQFFPDLKYNVNYWVDILGINVIVSGLDGDFKRQPLGQILELIPYSDECTKLNSLCGLCKNGNSAPFTRRISKSKESVLIGGSESYIPVCRYHYIQNKSDETENSENSENNTNLDKYDKGQLTNEEDILIEDIIISEEIEQVLKEIYD